MTEAVYVHITREGFHPNNVYRVVDSGTVAERGWTSGAGMWAVPESDRQVCPKPDAIKCGCTVMQRPERPTNYPVAGHDGTEFIGGRHVYTGPRSYRVGPMADGSGRFLVMSCHGGSQRPAAVGLTEDEAHAMAARLAAPRA